ncbi:PspC domain-containing protein [Nocardia yunnanensis]|uniref:PspC domain-containing protein n=1 Tax=Nocardia yunnanensis TaxID=2382165 RepID=A0A386ZJ91_9NOCA|nr:PspC domain-containing protein [Nocardia yunnanensis]AYF76645.1 PspC domain-containing protein [Nocardia yunnanensis]
MTSQIPTYTEQPHKRLTRSSTDKWIGGVCGGLGEYFGWSPNLVRILFVASCLLPGPQFLLYLALWIIIPKR